MTKRMLSISLFIGRLRREIDEVDNAPKIDLININSHQDHEIIGYSDTQTFGMLRQWVGIKLCSAKEEEEDD